MCWAVFEMHSNIINLFHYPWGKYYYHHLHFTGEKTSPEGLSNWTEITGKWQNWDLNTGLPSVFAPYTPLLLGVPLIYFHTLPNEPLLPDA